MTKFLDKYVYYNVVHPELRTFHQVVCHFQHKIRFTLLKFPQLDIIYEDLWYEDLRGWTKCPLAELFSLFYSLPDIFCTSPLIRSDEDMVNEDIPTITFNIWMAYFTDQICSFLVHREGLPKEIAEIIGLYFCKTVLPGYELK